MPLSVIDSLSFFGNRPSVVQVASGIYAIAFDRGLTPDGWLVTVSIDAVGNIGGAVIDSFEFETTQGRAPSLIHISGDIYAIAYEDVNGNGQLITVEIDSAGNITQPRLDILEFYTYAIGSLDSLNPHIVHISGSIFAIAYRENYGTPNSGWLKTVEIDGSGNITAPVVDSYEFDTLHCSNPHIQHIYGTVYAIAYQGTANGWIKTITIENNGTITLPIIDNWNYSDPHGQAYNPNMAHIAGDIYAIVYTGLNNDGYLKTVEIDTAGNIGAVIGTFEFDEVNGREPYIIKLTSGLCAIAYRGADNDGFVITIAIATNGTIGSIEETLEYDTSSGFWPYIFQISPEIIAIAYGSDGKVRTISGFFTLPTVQTNPATEIT